MRGWGLVSVIRQPHRGSCITLKMGADSYFDDVCLSSSGKRCDHLWLVGLEVAMCLRFVGFDLVNCFQLWNMALTIVVKIKYSHNRILKLLLWQNSLTLMKIERR